MLPAKNHVIYFFNFPSSKHVLKPKIVFRIGAIIATCPDESSLADSSGVIMDFNMQTQATLKGLEKSLINLSDSRSDRSDYSVRKTEC